MSSLSAGVHSIASQGQPSLSRPRHAALAISSAVTGTVDLVGGIGVAVVALLYTGTNKAPVFRDLAEGLLDGASTLGSHTYKGIVGMLVPENAGDKPSIERAHSADDKYRDHLETMLRPGPVAARLWGSLGWLAQECSHSKNPWAEHLGSRACYAGLAVLSPIARLIDLVIGIVLLPFAFLATLFSYIAKAWGGCDRLDNVAQKLNRLVVRSLRPFAIITDPLKAVMRACHPHDESRRDIEEMTPTQTKRLTEEVPPAAADSNRSRAGSLPPRNDPLMNESSGCCCMFDEDD